MAKPPALLTEYDRRVLDLKRLEKENLKLQHALEVAMYWLLRAHGSFRVSTAWSGGGDTIDGIATFLENHGVDPDPKGNNAGYLRAKAILKRCPEAFHHELEKAVKRGSK